MHRPKNLLAWLRRQREGLGRVVVVSFAAASFALTSAPCFAMAAASTDAAVAAPATVSHHPAGHESSGHHAHDAAAPAAPAAHGGTDAPGSVHCPHCPAAGVMPGHTSSSAHSACSAAVDVADQTSSSPPAFAKHVPLVATFETPLPLALRPPAAQLTKTPAPHRSAVALNVRHCVYLI
jgi:hypothetical protein